MKDIVGASILITGGGSGLGAGMARYFAARGARVTICGRRGDKLAAVAGSIGPACKAVQADIDRDDDRHRAIDAALAHGGRLDALVNNAANMSRGPITELREDDLRAVFQTNVVSGMMLSGLAVPHLAKTRGAIIFFGSVHTRRAYPGASPYAATKGATEALSRVLAAELGPKQIRVGCIVPGAVPTELNIRAGLFTEEQHKARMDAIAPYHALGRVGTEEEIAEATEYLIRAEWTTGTSIVVDGGLSLGISPF